MFKLLGGIGYKVKVIQNSYEILLYQYTVQLKINNYIHYD